jgi:probable rRNA maturation factor
MILNQQRRVSVSVPALERFLSRVLGEVGLERGSLSVALVTDGQIARWNLAYRGKNRPTDVLSFATDAPARGPRKESSRGTKSKSTVSLGDDSYLGDIAIAPSVALRNASQLGRTLDQEMRILILHGVLHLMGYDHEADNGQMNRRETHLRRKLGLR